ncbi:MAG: hypothetical protein CSA84_02420 [Actinomycetales bacterium]|nr:MAG: hypothetical protein CSA84_02420 [Actinomycetales bacterium]
MPIDLSPWMDADLPTLVEVARTDGVDPEELVALLADQVVATIRQGTTTEITEGARALSQLSNDLGPEAGRSVNEWAELLTTAAMANDAAAVPMIMRSFGDRAQKLLELLAARGRIAAETVREAVDVTPSVTPSNFSHLVNRLERAGLVAETVRERERDLSLTPAGQRYINAHKRSRTHRQQPVLPVPRDLFKSYITEFRGKSFIYGHKKGMMQKQAFSTTESAPSRPDSQ